MVDTRLRLINNSLDSFIEYFLDSKPYHTKLLDVIETYRIHEEIRVDIKEDIKKEIIKVNDPLCLATGFGLDYDDPCGYSAYTCCDLFDCFGGYGVYFDNSDNLVSEDIVEINDDEGYITLSNNHTSDVRINIKDIPNIHSLVLNGNFSSYFANHKILLVVDVVKLTIVNVSSDAITVEGNHSSLFANRNNFHIIGENTSHNGTHHFYSVEYDEGSDSTILYLSKELNSNLSSLLGVEISVKNNNPNTGVYEVLNYSYNSSDDETVVNLSTNTPLSNDAQDLNEYQLGSVQLRTGLKYPRLLSIDDGNFMNTSQEQDHKILFSNYDYDTNLTRLYLSGNLSVYDQPAMIRTFGYFFPAGLDGGEECTPPKDENISVGLEEFLEIISVDEFVISVKPWGINSKAVNSRSLGL
jgi:hypothetical protein